MCDEICCYTVSPKNPLLLCWGRLKALRSMGQRRERVATASMVIEQAMIPPPPLS